MENTIVETAATVYLIDKMAPIFVAVGFIILTLIGMGLKKLFGKAKPKRKGEEQLDKLIKSISTRFPEAKWKKNSLYYKDKVILRYSAAQWPGLNDKVEFGSYLMFKYRPEDKQPYVTNDEYIKILDIFIHYEENLPKIFQHIETTINIFKD